MQRLGPEFIECDLGSGRYLGRIDDRAGCKRSVRVWPGNDDAFDMHQHAARKD